MDKNVEIMGEKIVKDLVQVDDCINKDADNLMKEDVETTTTIKVHKNDAHSMRSSDSPMCSHHMTEIAVECVDVVPSEGFEMLSTNIEAEVVKMQQVAAVNVEAIPHTVDDVVVPRKRRNKGPSSTEEYRNSFKIRSIECGLVTKYSKR